MAEADLTVLVMEVIKERLEELVSVVNSLCVLASNGKIQISISDPLENVFVCVQCMCTRERKSGKREIACVCVYKIERVIERE